MSFVKPSPLEANNYTLMSSRIEGNTGYMEVKCGCLPENVLICGDCEDGEEE